MRAKPDQVARVENGCWFRGALVFFELIVHATPLLAAEVFRVGFPSLATGFAPSWVTADKGIWKKHGLDVELIYLRGGSRTVSALIGGSVRSEERRVGTTW